MLCMPHDEKKLSKSATAFSTERVDRTTSNWAMTFDNRTILVGNDETKGSNVVLNEGSSIASQVESLRMLDKGMKMRTIRKEVNVVEKLSFPKGEGPHPVFKGR